MSYALVAPSKNGVKLRLRLTPKSSQDKIVGVEQGPDGPVLAVKVRAIPDKGKANSAVLKLISRWVVLPQAEINLVSGHKSRFKTVEILGNEERLMEHINLLLRDLDKQ